VQAQAVKEAAVCVQELESQVVALKQERAQLRIQTDSHLDSKNELTEAVSKDAGIASLEADVRALEGELECAKLQVEQHSGSHESSRGTVAQQYRDIGGLEP